MSGKSIKHILVSDLRTTLNLVRKQTEWTEGQFRDLQELLESATMWLCENQRRLDHE